MYFGHYKRALYIAQTDDPALQKRARAAARELGLSYEYRFPAMAILPAGWKPQLKQTCRTGCDWQLTRGISGALDGTVDYTLLAGHSGAGHC